MVPHILRDMVDGVAHLHDMRIVHRDLKPHNVLLVRYISKEKFVKHIKTTKEQKQQESLITGIEHPRSKNRATIGKKKNGDSLQTNAPITKSTTIPRRYSSAPSGAADGDEDWGRTHRAKISDMGLGKQLQGDLSSFGHGGSYASHRYNEHNGKRLSSLSKSYRRRHLGVRGTSYDGSRNSSMAHVGTIGWQAPEVLLTRKKNHQKRRGLQNASGRHCRMLCYSLITCSRDMHNNVTYSISFVYNTATVGITIEDVDGSCKSESFSEEVDTTVDQHYRLTRAVDIFSLGCIFYCTAVPDGHPFGDPLERQQNIINGKRDLSALDKAPELQDLVAKVCTYVHN